MKKHFLSFMLLGLVSASPVAHAELIRAEAADMDVPEAVMRLEAALLERGLKITRIQYVSNGLHKNGYVSDELEVAFITPGNEVVPILKAHPELEAVLPMTVSLIQHGSSVSMVSAGANAAVDMLGAQAGRDIIKGWNEAVKLSVQEVLE